MTRLTRILSVRLRGDRRVELTLTDGRTKVVDLEPLLRGPIFDEIRLDDEAFARVRLEEVPAYGRRPTSTVR